MIGPSKLALLFLFSLFTLVACSKTYVPVEPALNTGTVFQ